MSKIISPEKITLTKLLAVIAEFSRNRRKDRSSLQISDTLKEALKFSTERPKWKCYGKPVVIFTNKSS